MGSMNATTTPLATDVCPVATINVAHRGSTRFVLTNLSNSEGG